MSIVDEREPGFSPLQIRVAGYVVTGLAVAAGIAAIFVKTQLVTATDLALALASIVFPVWAPELFEITTRSRGRTGRGANPFMLIPALLAFMAALMNDFASVQPLLIGAAAGVAVAGGIAWLRRMRPGVAGPIQLVVLAAMAGGLLGFGAPALIDVRFDGAPAQPYRATVASMYVSHGKSTTYNLRLAPWGPMAQSGSVQVSSALYSALNPGDQVCVAWHGGALSIPWYVLRQCEGPA